jgi:hypothetical protein
LLSPALYVCAAFSEGERKPVLVLGAGVLVGVGGTGVLVGTGVGEGLLTPPATMLAMFEYEE